jgi:hypothetical protein
MFPQIVEELEDRFADQIDDILSTVRSSLSDSAVVQSSANGTTDGEAASEQVYYSEENYMEEAEGWEHGVDEAVFDDTGEGAGIEGDLDVEDD